MAGALAYLNVRVGADISDLQRKLKTVNSTVKKLSRDLERTGRSLTRGVTLPIAAIAGASIKMAGDFQQSMNRVKAVSGATEAEFRNLTKVAKDLGATTQFSASEAAEGLAFLAQAGFKATEAAEALPGVLNLAAAGAIELGEAADIASNILSGFGLEVKELNRVNDVLTKTFTSTNTNMLMLGEAFQYVGPVASGLGLTIEETAAAIGLLGNAGIQASAAGTALRGALTRLVNPTSQEAEILKRLNVQVKDGHGNMLPFVQIIRQLEKAGASTADIMALFGDRAGPGMAALVSQGSAALEKLTDENLASAGTAARIAATQMEGFNGQMKELRSAAEALAISIGESGLLGKVTTLAKSFTTTLQRLNETNPELLNTAVNIALIAAAVGPALLVLAKMVTVFGTLYKAALALKGAMIILNTATVGWFGTIGAGLAVVGTLFIGARNGIRGINKEIKEGVGQLETLRKFQGVGGAAYSFQIAQGKDRSAPKAPVIAGNTIAGLRSLGLGLQEVTQKIPPYIAAVKDVKKTTDDIIPPLGGSTKEVVNLAKAFDALVTAALKASRQVDLKRLSTPKLGDITTERERINTRGLSIDPMEGLTSGQQNLLDISAKVNESLKEQGSIMEGLSLEAPPLGEAFYIAAEALDFMAQSMARVADAGGTFKDVAAEIKRSAISVIGSMIRQGVATVVQGTLSKMSFLGPLAIPAGLAAGALAQGAFNSILSKVSVPAFAGGGIISGPTLGLMGEYKNAANNPEVVAPLDRLRNLMGSSNITVNVVGKISGRDIQLANDRNSIISSRLKGK